VEKARKIITKNTRIVSFASVGNMLGQLNPIAEIIDIAKKVGAYVTLDCAQSATYFKDDLFALGVDALAFSAHKIYGPSGIGILALSPELMKNLPPLQFGGGMISSVTKHESQWAQGPAKFEAGTPAITEVAGLLAAIEWIESIGAQKMHTRSCALAASFAEQLAQLPHIDILSSVSGKESLVTFHHKKIHAHDLVTILNSSNICMRAGHHCAWPLIHELGVDAGVRASFAAYNDELDVAIAIEGIKNSLNFT
jgi:cysteine desulfurase/selenocysteine lyase